jgi:hypothetical protein
MNFTMPALDFFHLILNRQWPPIIITYCKYVIFYKEWGDLSGACRCGRDAPESKIQPAQACSSRGETKGVTGRPFPGNLRSGYFSLP